jgi:CheY-like chemotaxis protein
VTLPKGLVVLLAEDNEVNQELATAMLRRRGCDVLVAKDGREAVALWERERFDVVLMDVQMPEMDGLAATRAIREIERSTGGHTPIVALTAHVLEGDRVRCRTAGMDGYVSKPLRVGDLFQAIAEVLPQAASTRSAGVPPELEACLDSVGGERAALEKIVTLFLEQYPVLLTQIRDAANEGDCTTAAKAAHRLSGSLGVLAATQALEAARRVEQLSALSDREGLDAAVTALEHEVAECVGPLERFYAATRLARTA